MAWWPPAGSNAIFCRVTPFDRTGLVLAAGGILACAGPTDPGPPETTPAAITVAAGDHQTAPVGTPLPAPLTVVVVSGTDQPLAGVTVRFSVTGGRGTIAQPATTTDSAGSASTQLTLGATAGVVTVTTTVAGTDVKTTLRAIALAPDPDSTAAAAVYNPDWTTVSHGAAAPDYGTVFPQSSVNELEIVITPAQWLSLRANMKQIYGFDFGGDPGPPTVFPDEDPEYLPVLLRFGGKAWKKSGFRLKGQSSLGASWGNGIRKLPFKLKMSEFESVYPAIKGQRFFGFKELSFSPGYLDNSLLHEKVAADLFRAGGVPAARTAFYRVSIDFGEGLKYCGVYTMVETIEDTMVKDQFGESAGNIYKPESQLRFFRTNQFEKKNNKSAADYSDVQAMITALNSSSRTANPGQWRSSLEAVFDVHLFLRWLAVSNTMVNWDSYGFLPHNYYLYRHSTGRIKWIPWDHNEALVGSPGIAGETGAGVVRRAGLTLTMNEVDAGWPLIRFLAEDPVYFARYREYLKTFVTTVFTPAGMTARLTSANTLIAPYVVGPGGERPGYTQLSDPARFSASLAELIAHADRRRALVTSFVP